MINVQKDPITDPGKKSKAGRVTLTRENGEWKSGIEDWHPSALETVFENGQLIKEYTFEEVRANSNKQ